MKKLPTNWYQSYPHQLFIFGWHVRTLLHL